MAPVEALAEIPSPAEDAYRYSFYSKPGILLVAKLLYKTKYPSVCPYVNYV